jgi:hypothetical protein
MLQPISRRADCDGAQLLGAAHHPAGKRWVNVGHEVKSRDPRGNSTKSDLGSVAPVRHLLSTAP